MNKLKIITIFLLLVTSTNLIGQTNSEINNKEPYIEVTGTAEKEIVPDEIYISITIRERQEGKEKITIEKQEADLKEALKSIGISLDNFFISDANANYIRVNWTKKEVVAKSEYLLKVNDASTLGKVFQKMGKLKIKEAHVSKVSHSKILDFKKEVRISAIKAAKQKADYLLNAIGEQTGQALKIHEENPNYLKDDSYLNIRQDLNKSAYGSFDLEDKLRSSHIIQFKKIKLQASIYVKFRIK